MRRVIRAVRDAGYDGYVSVEFEGMEDSETGSRISMENLRQMWSQAEEEGRA
jgi:sugar phosphate isomerase/epimerase